jgi:hypothetical protein
VAFSAIDHPPLGHLLFSSLLSTRSSTSSCNIYLVVIDEYIPHVLTHEGIFHEQQLHVSGVPISGVPTA